MNGGKYLKLINRIAKKALNWFKTQKILIELVVANMYLVKLCIISLGNEESY